MMMSSGKKLCSVNGIPMYLNLKEGIQKAMASNSYEPAETNWVKKHLLRGGIFIDVGASFGYYTTLARSLVGEEGKVFSFEPSPVAYATLKDAVDRSNLANVIVTNAAVGRKKGELILYLPPADELHSPSAFKSHSHHRPVTVPLIALDDFEPLLHCPPIDMMKIDVEGSEPDVLEGMRGLATGGKIKRVICEFNSWWLKANHTKVEDLFALFKELGFEIEEETEWKRNLPAIKGETFDMQDVLFRHKG
jgi:FkbM family methyltransferase